MGESRLLVRTFKVHKVFNEIGKESFVFETEDVIDIFCNILQVLDTLRDNFDAIQRSFQRL